jgi:aspartyl-tRNA(Asn)/glutamyl-tRNA(Gln) amidotransferase subunit C
VTGNLSREDVRRVAELARLSLSDREIDLFARQLAHILAWVGEIDRADTAGVPPTSHVAGVAEAWREDREVPSLDRRTVLAAAPDADVEAGVFRVPKVR